MRIDAGWPASKPPAKPADPADPAYNFTTLDSAVREAISHGVRPLLSFDSAPPWAEGPNPPSNVPAGSWMPSPAAVGEYGRALATRYDGSFPDPLHPGQTLPRVTLFQLWNEPNLSQYLNPQWQHTGGKWVPEAAVEYRAMLNAFYAGVKAAQPSATVVSAGTAPFGDFGHGSRIMPVQFWSDVLAAPTSFDVLAHQPYSVGAPPTKAINADDVSIPDIGKLTKVLRGAEQRGHALPRGYRHPIWITEMGYNSDPPNPQGVPVATQARWIEQAFYLLWRQGVRVVINFLIQDAPPQPQFGLSAVSGLYFASGQAKPAATAFRFPVVGHRVRGGQVHAWVRAPASGRLRVYAREHSRWVLAASARTFSGEVLDLAVRGRPTALKASDGELNSLVWTM